MPKLVLKSEVSENIELLVQIAKKLGFEVSMKKEKSKKKDKSKKGKSKEKDYFEFSKKDKSSKSGKVKNDEEDVLAKGEEESTKSSEKLAKIKVKNIGKDKMKSKGYYEMDDDFMKDF